jgi:thiamine kinase-like enzyme
MAVESIRALPLWRGEVRVERLEGGLTNVNYKATDERGTFVVRECADDPVLGIDRACEILCARIAAARGIAPRLLHEAPGFLVFEWVDGTTLTPELVREPDRLVRIATLLRSVHDAGPDLRGTPRWFSPFAVTRGYLEAAVQHGWQLPTDDPDALRADIDALEARVPPFMPTLCHNDLMPGNLIDAGDRLWLIDWEYAAVGHPAFDLAGLCSNCELDATAEARLLGAYWRPATKAHAELHRVLVAMAALRESLWAVVHAPQSKVAFDYQGYRDGNWRKFEAARTAAG